MYIILGASGQVGSAIVANLVKKGHKVRGIVRTQEKAAKLEESGAEAFIADATDLDALKEAFKDGKYLFVLTPETGKEEDVLGETKTILENYRHAVEASSIEKIVGLSSIGAQYESGTGNLLMSHMLENAFIELPVTQIFIRPAYYFSNWLMNLETVKEKNILPTFYPVDMTLPMISPMDVAEFTAGILASNKTENKIYEVFGPGSYSSTDVAAAFSKTLKKDIKAQQTPREAWEGIFTEIGFTKDATKNFIEMTEAVISGSTEPERDGVSTIITKTTLQEYIDNTPIS